MNFNKEQKEAINHLHGPLLILAGAGSGKTTVLTHRISTMIQSGILPDNILAITFTNKAVNEMKGRMKNLVGESIYKKIWISTFHATCSKILQHEKTESSLLPNDFSIIDQNEARQIIKSIIEKDKKVPKHLKPYEIQRYISMLKNEMVDVHSLRKNHPTNPYIDWVKVKKIIQTKIPKDTRKHVFYLYQAYQKELEKKHLFDFEDLILKTIHLFLNDQKILEKYQEKFRYILIDEYQDTNHAQFVFVHLLSKKYRNIAVVGDDFQSIYAFRGSDIRNILSFDEHFPDAKVVKLEENYRCAPFILQAANEVIAKNKFQKEKKLYTTKETGDKLGYFCACDERDEARFITKSIHDFLEKGYQFSDIAILYRTHYIANTIQEHLLKNSIPFYTVDEVDFYHHTDIQSILSFMCFISDTERTQDFLKTINYPTKRISSSHLNLLLKNRNGSFFDYLKQEHTFLTEEEKINLNDYILLIQRFQTLQGTLSFSDWVILFILETGIFKKYKKLDENKQKENEKMILSFIDIVLDFDVKFKNASTLSFLKHLASCFFEEKKMNENAIQMMSVHSAKGLEFPIVFVIGVEEGVFPHQKALDTNDIEEERRLFYVALTRAKEKLFITHALKRKRWDRLIDHEPSRFIYEFNPSYFDQITPLAAQNM